MSAQPLLHGVIPALVTPFTSDGTVDAASLERLIEHQIDAGAHGALINGLAGEGIFLSQAEREQVADIAFAVAGTRLPLLVGCTADTTAESVALVRSAVQRGAAGVMVAPSRRPGQTPEDLLAHYSSVASAAGDVEVMVQDAPFAVGIELGVDLVVRMAHAHANVGAFKLEALPYWDAASRTRATVGTQMRMFGGHAGLYLMDVIDSGAAGLIPGADVTASLVQAWEAGLHGDRAATERIYQRLLPLLVFQAQSLGTIIGCAKAVLHARGLLSTTYARHPQATLSAAAVERTLHYAQQAGELA